MSTVVAWLIFIGMWWLAPYCGFGFSCFMLCFSVCLILGSKFGKICRETDEIRKEIERLEKIKSDRYWAKRLVEAKEKGEWPYGPH